MPPEIRNYFLSRTGRAARAPDYDILETIFVTFKSCDYMPRV